MNAQVSLKAYCNRLHTRQRVAERYGLALTPDDIFRIECLIQAGDPEAICVAGAGTVEGRPVYAVKWDRVWLPICYDPLTRSVITVLPEHTLDPYRAFLDPVPVPAPAPEPPPPPPAPAPAKAKATAKARAGKVIGYRPIPPDPRFAVDAALLAVPEVPDVPEGASLAAYDAAIEAVRARSCALNDALGRAMTKEVKRQLGVQLHRNGALLRSLRGRRHVEYTGRSVAERAARLGVATTDGAAVIGVLHAALRRLSLRIGLDRLDPADHDARTLAREWLERHARDVPHPLTDRST